LAGKRGQAKCRECQYIFFLIIDCEEIPELLSYMDDVMPKKKDGDKQGDDALDAGINVEEYLLGLDGCDHNCKNKYSEQMF
jgi:hypothetical protein